MKLISCRVQNYRSIMDSGWVDINDIAVIVGKNESGKTSFLKALWKFHPFHDEGYNLSREWPRGRRKEMSPDKTVVETRFTFSKEEIAAIDQIHDSAKGIKGVEIARTYAGKYSHRFVPSNPHTEHAVEWVVDLVRARLATLPHGFSEHFQAQYASKIEQLVVAIVEHGGSAYALAQLPAFKQEFLALRHPEHPQQEQDSAGLGRLNDAVDEVIREIASSPLLRVVDYVHQILPTFVYMDDYRTFVGSAQLDEVLTRKVEKRLTPEDETIIVIMEMAGLALEDEVRKGRESDREQRILDLNDASQTLTRLIADRWSQRKYEVTFQADGQHFFTFVKDMDERVLVPLEDRSRGFQWFFSFDMLFMYETRGKFKNAIILLDEPGLHLHATAQRDLLRRLKTYSTGNQLFYTTHLPFMIDFKRLDNIYVAEESRENGTKVHKNWATADKDARFTLQAALGLSWSQSLFVGRFNLVVEEVDDFWFLTVFSTMFQEAGLVGLDPRLSITPAGGASKVAFVGTILQGQQLNVAVLLASDPPGQQAYDQLARPWIAKDRLVITVGDAVGLKPSALEDLFSEGYYRTKAQESYAKELGGRALTLDAKTAGRKSIVERVGDAFAELGLGEFHKGRVAKRIMTELGQTELKSVEADTVSKFRKLIDAINTVSARWR